MQCHTDLCFSPNDKAFLEFLCFERPIKAFLKKNNKPTNQLLSLHIYKIRAFYHVSHSWGGGVTPFACTHRKKGKGWGDLKIKTEQEDSSAEGRRNAEKVAHRTTAFLLAPGLLGTGVPGSLSSDSPGLDS